MEKNSHILCNNLIIEQLDVIDSTNTYARKKAMDGAPEGYVVIANSQTAGRGRRGRSFYSPEGTGLYMSIVLRPGNCPAEQATRFTTMAAVAVCEAIEAVSGREAGIKWVNDIFMDGKKVCGILTEASLDMKNGLVDYAILGIGVNVMPPKGGFPAELTDIAHTVFDEFVPEKKEQLTAQILNLFMDYYKFFSQKTHVKMYRKRCFVVGENVDVVVGEERRKAFVLDVDDECHLIVRYEDGTEEILSSGEISIRL